MTLERTKVETTALHAVVQKARAMLALRTPLESVGPTDIHLMDQLLAI